MPDWKSWVVKCSTIYKVNKDVVFALLETESSLGKKRFRFGRVGSVWLPGGIKDCFRREKGWPVDNVYVNIEVAVRALSHHLKKEGSLRKALRKYNTAKDGFDSYYNRVVYLARQNQARENWLLGIYKKEQNE